MDQRTMVALRIVQKDQLPVAGDVVGNAARGLKLVDVPALETPDQRRKHFLKVVMLSPHLVMLSLSKHGGSERFTKMKPSQSATAAVLSGYSVRSKPGTSDI